MRRGKRPDGTEFTGIVIGWRTFRQLTRKQNGKWHPETTGHRVHSYDEALSDLYDTSLRCLDTRPAAAAEEGLATKPEAGTRRYEHRCRTRREGPATQGKRNRGNERGLTAHSEPDRYRPEPQSQALKRLLLRAREIEALARAARIDAARARILGLDPSSDEERGQGR